MSSSDRATERKKKSQPSGPGDLFQPKLLIDALTFSIVMYDKKDALLMNEWLILGDDLEEVV